MLSFCPVWHSRHVAFTPVRAASGAGTAQKLRPGTSSGDISSKVKLLAAMQEKSGAKQQEAVCATSLPSCRQACYSLPFTANEVDGTTCAAEGAAAPNVRDVTLHMNTHP